jgi:hypothetical protein
LGIEKHFLGLLFQYGEVSESVYKRILTKLDIQLDRVERGDIQIQSLYEEFPTDWFEQLASGARRILFLRQGADDRLQEQYMYYRAQEILSRKVTKEFFKFKNHQAFAAPAYDALLEKVIASYQEFHDDAHHQKEGLVEKNQKLLNALDEAFGKESLHKALAQGLSELTRKNMLPPKLAILLEEDFSSL